MRLTVFATFLFLPFLASCAVNPPDEPVLGHDHASAAIPTASAPIIETPQPTSRDLIGWARNTLVTGTCPWLGVVGQERLANATIRIQGDSLRMEMANWPNLTGTLQAKTGGAGEQTWSAKVSGDTIFMKDGLLKYCVVSGTSTVTEDGVSGQFTETVTDKEGNSCSSTVTWVYEDIPS